VKGQERAKRALEIAAAGRHHVLMVGAPGSGKSMLAARLPGILPPLSAAEALETSMIHSLAGLLDEGGISRIRPFREPHHTASMAAIVGGGRGAKPGEISLAHNGVLFHGRVPRISPHRARNPAPADRDRRGRRRPRQRPCPLSLPLPAGGRREPLQMRPPRRPERAPAPGCRLAARTISAAISGPLMDRFDLRIEVPPVAVDDLDAAGLGRRLRRGGRPGRGRPRHAGARASTGTMGCASTPMPRARCSKRSPRPMPRAARCSTRVAERFGLSARGYHRVLRVARTIADLDGAAAVRAPHVAEAVSYRDRRGAGSASPDERRRPRERGVGLGHPALQDRPDMRRILGQRSSVTAPPGVLQPCGHAPRVVAQDLGPRGLQEDRRRAREIGEKRRGARVARIGALQVGAARLGLPTWPAKRVGARRSRRGWRRTGSWSVQGEKATSPAGRSPRGPAACASSASASPPPALSPASTISPAA
jgi:energy-coupling factor transporter ATP-binding protein EcfA2